MRYKLFGKNYLSQDVQLLKTQMEDKVKGLGEHKRQSYLMIQASIVHYNTLLLKATHGIKVNTFNECI